MYVVVERLRKATKPVLSVAMVFLLRLHAPAMLLFCFQLLVPLPPGPCKDSC